MNGFFATGVLHVGGFAPHVGGDPHTRHCARKCESILGGRHFAFGMGAAHLRQALRRAGARTGAQTPPFFLPAHPTFVHERGICMEVLWGAPASRSFLAADSGNGVPKDASPSQVAVWGGPQQAPLHLPSGFCMWGETPHTPHVFAHPPTLFAVPRGTVLCQEATLHSRGVSALFSESFGVLCTKDALPHLRTDCPIAPQCRKTL